VLDLTFTEPAPKVMQGTTGPWELVIGMEVHAQVSSTAKLFSGGSTDFGSRVLRGTSRADGAGPQGRD